MPNIAQPMTARPYVRPRLPNRTAREPGTDRRVRKQWAAVEKLIKIRSFLLPQGTSAPPQTAAEIRESLSRPRAPWPMTFNIAFIYMESGGHPISSAPTITDLASR